MGTVSALIRKTATVPIVTVPAVMNRLSPNRSTQRPAGTATSSEKSPKHAEMSPISAGPAPIESGAIRDHRPHALHRHGLHEVDDEHPREPSDDRVALIATSARSRWSCRRTAHGARALRTLPMAFRGNDASELQARRDLVRRERLAEPSRRPSSDSRDGRRAGRRPPRPADPTRRRRRPITAHSSTPGARRSRSRSRGRKP